jgi:hypothetical protein
VFAVRVLRKSRKAARQQGDLSFKGE